MGAKIYELYIDKFAQNIQGLIDHLDHFSRLGVNTLHILPHYPSPMIDAGYDITDFRGVRSDLGSTLDLERLIVAAHEKGLRIILDFVVNHVSSEHPWFQEAQASKENPKRNYFLWSETGEELRGSVNAFPGIKQHNWIRNPKTNDYYYATFYPEQPDLNWDNEEVISAMFDNMDFLAHLGADGFRIDAAPHLIKREGTDSRGLPETHKILKRMRAHLEEKYPGVILLAEAGGNIEETKSYFGNGDEFHMAYHFPLMSALWETLLFNDQTYVDDVMRASGDIPQGCQWATFLRNHDDIELRNLPSETREKMINMLDPKREYLFNNGNTTAVRIATAFSEDKEKILQAFGLLYSLPGAPVCYYGDEIGMKNTPARPDVIDTRFFVRGEFDWADAVNQMNDSNSLFAQIAKIITRKT
ncbi:MAG: hypothetical protein A2494_03190 [Candidatus Lloydbacteria bacterium RIFOXYC12_FULL_46_25]|uniref:Alpha-amylase n=1 Tax=Candidatus Lloydbacteria bacterium RIFOXYC12_FULL_46_25 TaxID=1798670 RepID=A0A1G2DUW7_9BACT|nr:MAG: hypothetical protein A2494_03190 [Candidatus Lloydbacteria bacterium RIFOXYC12_FULL_46_25]